MGGEPDLDRADLGRVALVTRSFLGLPTANAGPDARVWALPLPYEATTTYGRGTINGPDAIISASAQVELYDRRLQCEPALQFGVHTLPALQLDCKSPELAISQIASAVSAYCNPGRLLCVLGGEHGASIGVAQGLRDVFGEFVTVQVDAHADLRDSYDGSRFNHACTARRIIEMGSLVVQVGVRSIDITEAEFMRVHPDLVQTVFADDSFRDRSCLSEVQAAVNGKKVYLSIDVDALDPSVIPATGTPEPGGLQWQDLRDIVAVVAASSHVLAFDCMELSPIPGLNFPDFAAAKLVYETMSAIMGSPSWQDTGLNP